MEITQVKTAGGNGTYLAHYDSGQVEQYKLYGSQGAYSRRILKIKDIRDGEQFARTCQYKARLSKEQAKSQAIKAITLFLMQNPESQFKNKTALISALKSFADSKKIKVSSKRLTEQYPQIKGLVQAK